MYKYKIYETIKNKNVNTETIALLRYFRKETVDSSKAIMKFN